MAAQPDVMRVVSVADSAIDVEAMNAKSDIGDPIIIRYAETRNPALLKFEPGSKPTWFLIRRLRASEFNRYVRSAATEHEQYVRAFAIGVVRIEDIRLLESKQHVNAYEPEGSVKRDGGLSAKYFTDEQIDEIPPAYVEEIGKLVFDRAFLAHAREVCFPLPLSFQLVWVERTFRNAVAVHRAQQSQSSEQPSQTHSETASSGDEGTDVSVMVKATD